MQSKLLNCVVALAMLVATPGADAECWINADGTMSCSRNPVQGQPVRNVVRYAAAPVVRAATAPVRMVRRGLFGRARYSVQPQATQSSGSSGSYGTYQATTQSYGSSGGTATYQSSGSSGGLGSYGDGPTQSRATAAPVTKAAPAASVPLSQMSDEQLDETLGVCDHGPDCLRNQVKAIYKKYGKAPCPCGPDCDCGPDCQCQTQVCTVPPAAPSTRYCIVPPASVSSTCRVPSGLSVEAVASL
jgi:hypothetical protein